LIRITFEAIDVCLIYMVIFISQSMKCSIAQYKNVYIFAVLLQGFVITRQI